MDQSTLDEALAIADDFREELGNADDFANMQH